MLNVVGPIPNQLGGHCFWISGTSDFSSRPKSSGEFYTIKFALAETFPDYLRSFLKTETGSVSDVSTHSRSSMIYLMGIEGLRGKGMIFKATDDELMKKVAAGNHAAFRDLFDRHGSRVLGYCSRFTGNRGKGEDIAQEVWMKVIKASNQYDGQGKFLSWVLTIARTTCLSASRSSKTKLEVSIDETVEFAIAVDERGGLLEAMEKSENLAQLKSQIDALPDMQREALILWMTHESSYDDIAVEMNLSVSSVKSLLFRAKQRLEKALRGES